MYYRRNIMDREKFVEELHKMDPDYNPGYVKKPTEIDDVMQACIDHAKNNYMRDNNMYQFAVVIEEMAELTQELTKMLRGRDNRTGVIEELADVQLCVWVTMKMLGITDDEINQAIQVKSDRQRNKKCKKKSLSAFCQNIIQIIEICGEILNDFLCCSGNFFVYNLQIRKIILY